MFEHNESFRYYRDWQWIGGRKVLTTIKESNTAIHTLGFNNGLYDISNSNELDIEEVLAQAEKILNQAK